MDRRETLRLCIALAAALLTGCALTRVDKGWVERRGLGGDLSTYQPPGEADSGKASPSEMQEPTGVLRLREALALALLHNPKLAAVSWNVRIGEARSLQAGLLPNPELEVEAGEVAGSGDRSGFDAAETTIRLSQLVELGGKRSARRHVADLEARLSGWDYEAERLAVFAEIALAFVDVLAAQERLRLAEELHRVSEQTHAAASERVKAGKVSPIESLKTSVEVAGSKIEAENARRNLNAARKRLAATWGSTSPKFEKAGGTLEEIARLPSFESLENVVAQNPEIARWTEEMEHRLAQLALKRARRVPDLAVSAGYQRFEETDDHAFVFGLAVPLPLFDRNQGGIREAGYRLRQAEHERMAAEVRTRTALSETYEALAAAHAEATVLKDEVLPAAQESFDAAREGYRQGKFGYLDVLDAQRTLFEARGRYLGAAATYHRAVAVIESLIGTGFDSLPEPPQKKD